MRVNVLVADDDNDVVELLSLRCRELGLSVDSANNAMTALKKAEQQLPDVVILDVEMPYGNGLSVCEMMADHEDLRSIPVIVLTGSKNEETVKRCHELCAYYVPKSSGLWAGVLPILEEVFKMGNDSATNEQMDVKAEEGIASRGPTDLMDAVFSVLGVEEGGNLLGDFLADEDARSDQPWVLSIEDDDDVALALQLRLKSYGIQVIRATAGTEGYRRAFLDAPRAIILDYELPQGNGDYVLRRLKETPATQDIPVIVLTGRKEASIERQMRSLGASEFFTKPYDWDKLRAALDLSLEQTEDHTLHAASLNT